MDIQAFNPSLYYKLLFDSPMMSYAPAIRDKRCFYFLDSCEAVVISVTNVVNVTIALFVVDVVVVVQRVGRFD